MEVSYDDFAVDIDHYRALGATEDALTRSNGLLNHYFFTASKLTELEQLLQIKEAHIARLEEQLFGSKGITIDAQAEESRESSGGGSGGDSANDPGKGGGSKKPKEHKGQSPKKPGHGRLGADAYTGAEVVECNHDHLKPGDTCPGCLQGRLYIIDPKKRVVIDGRAPLFATLYVMEMLRCALCGERFSATAPVDISKKYTPMSKAVLAYLHCGSGQPYNRIEAMQKMVGMPVPVSTQSDVLESMMGPLYPIFMRLIWWAANSDCIYQDDTFVKILSLIKENRKYVPERKGMTSSGFVTDGEHRVVLFFPGRKHAGEHFDELMAHRAEDADEILRMADALSANSKHDSPAKKCKCNGHAVRRFKPIKSIFPVQCEQILRWYSDVYDHDGFCKQHSFTPQERLKYHQTYSAPIMAHIKAFAEQQFAERIVEPNSALGRELTYLLNHWKELTQFLKIAGAPLDNNLCERILKILIMYRKNSQIYVTEYSAYNLHIITSIIATCRLNEIDAIDYLTQLQIHEEAVWANPDRWLPWSYKEAVEQLSQPPPDDLTGRQSCAIPA